MTSRCKPRPRKEQQPETQRDRQTDSQHPTAQRDPLEAGASGVQVGTMSPTAVKVNGVEVASDGSKAIVINLNLNQPSALGSVLSAWKGPKTAPEKPKAPTEEGSKAPPAFQGEQRVLGAIQIILGLVCTSFAVLFCFFGRTQMFYSGSGFWTGIPFIVAGAVSVVGGARGSKCWLAIASFFNWATVVVGIAGIVMITNDFMMSYYYPFNPDYLCDQEFFDFDVGIYNNNSTISYGTEQCKDSIYRLMSFFNSIRFMLLVVTSLALCIALYSVGYSCKKLCCNFTTDQEEEAIGVTNDQDPLIASLGSNYPEKPKMETV